MAESTASKLSKRIHTDGSTHYKSATAPANPVEGDLWYDTSNYRLKVYNGTSFLLTNQDTNYAVDFLVIAGGGGGGTHHGGGGAAGGYRTSTQTIDVGTEITITVGDGGSASTDNSENGGTGSNSSISGTGVTTITSAGGGGGAKGA